MNIQNVLELNKKDRVKYKSRNMYFDYVDIPRNQIKTNHEIYQIWSYNTIIGYFDKTSYYALFTSHKHSQTTSKQITQLCNENNINHDFIDMIFANMFTYSDLEKIIDLLK